jgi:hypothetical protein
MLNAFYRMMVRVRNRLLLLGLLMLFSWQALAQGAPGEKAPVNYPSAYGFGFKGGPDYVRVNFDPSIPQSLTRGYTAGLVFTYLSLPRAGLQAELNYVQRGWTPADSSSRQWHYLELPLLTHVVLGKKKSSFIINFGPSVSYLLSNPDTVTLVTQSFNHQADFKNVPHAFQYGLSLGIGYSLQTPLGRFRLEARLSHSLANALKGSSFTTSHYQVLGLSLVYLVEKK